MSAKQPNVWILLADGEHARVVTASAKEGQFHTEIKFQGAGTIGQHAGSRLDPHAQAKQHFAAGVAAQLDLHAQAHDFDQLVLAAPPRTLHDLREALGNGTSAKVVDSLNKDLVKLNDHDVSDHLAKWWLAPAVA